MQACKDSELSICLGFFNTPVLVPHETCSWLVYEVDKRGHHPRHHQHGHHHDCEHLIVECLQHHHNHNLITEDIYIIGVRTESTYLSISANMKDDKGQDIFGIQNQPKTYPLLDRHFIQDINQESAYDLG